MPFWPTTDRPLLLKLSDPRNDEAWQRFDGLYRRVIFRFARRAGADPTSADDVAADVMCRIARAATRWSVDQPPQKFAAWLTRVSHNSLVNVVCRELARRGTGGTTHQVSLEQRPQASERSLRWWEEDRRGERLLVAAESIRAEFDPTSWDAFWATHVDGESIADVATRLGKTCGAIYAIRSRIVRRLRVEVKSLEAEETGS